MSRFPDSTACVVLLTVAAMDNCRHMAYGDYSDPIVQEFHLTSLLF